MASDDALLVVDGTGVVVEWSRKAQTLFHRTGAETLGRPVAALLACAWSGAGGGGTWSAGTGRYADATANLAAGLLVRPVTRPDGAPAWGLFPAPTELDGNGVGPPCSRRCSPCLRSGCRSWTPICGSGG